MTPLVSFRDASIRSGEGLLFAGLNWEIFPGEAWAIVGPNASGKSLLAAALGGRVQVAQEGGFVPVRERVGLVSQADQETHAARYLGFHQARWNASEAERGPSVGEFLSPLGVEGRSPFEAESEIDSGAVAAFEARRASVVELFRLSPLLGRRVMLLSNGETRKLLLARALLGDPELLVLDDPFAGLDPASREELRAILDGLASSGRTLVVATAREDELPSSVERVLRVERCRVVAEGRPERREMRAEGREPPRGLVPVSAAVPAGAEPIVELRSVTLRYGEALILDRLDFTLTRGERCALLGPNGSGKSSLLSLILGDNPQAYANEIYLFGRRRGSGETIWDIKSRIGWVAPELLLHYPSDLLCLDVVLSGYRSSLGLYEDCGEEEVEGARRELAALGLEAWIERPLRELSQGRRRLVLLARALVARPELLVLDEPCQGLDDDRAELVISAVDRAIGSREGEGTSLIYVTHRASQMPECVTRVLRLEAGRARKEAIVPASTSQIPADPIN
jgi:molybdate transport system ATP-binding protein